MRNEQSRVRARGRAASLDALTSRRHPRRYLAVPYGGRQHDRLIVCRPGEAVTAGNDVVAGTGASVCWRRDSGSRASLGRAPRRHAAWLVRRSAKPPPRASEVAAVRLRPVGTGEVRPSQPRVGGRGTYRGVPRAGDGPLPAGDPGRASAEVRRPRRGATIRSLFIELVSFRGSTHSWSSTGPAEPGSPLSRRQPGRAGMMTAETPA